MNVTEPVVIMQIVSFGKRQSKNTHTAISKKDIFLFKFKRGTSICLKNSKTR